MNKSKKRKKESHNGTRKSIIFEEVSDEGASDIGEKDLNVEYKSRGRSVEKKPTEPTWEDFYQENQDLKQ